MRLFLAAILSLVTIAAVVLLTTGDSARVGVAGTLLGGVVGLVAGLLVEQERRRHENARRFEAERRTVYVQLLDHARRAEATIDARHIGLRADAAGSNPAGVPVPAAPDLAPIHQLRDEILLLAPFDVFAAAQELVTGVAVLDDDALATSEVDRVKAVRDLQAARQEFADTAKRDLATPTGLMGEWGRTFLYVRRRLKLVRQRPKEPAAGE